MTWVWWGLACALGMGAVDVISKRALQEFDPAIVGTARLGFGLPVLAIPILVGGWPTLPPTFWVTVAAMLPLELVAFFMLLEALRCAPLWETVPFLSLTPLLTIVASWLILGERITRVGFTGICAIVAGGYLLYGHELKSGYLGPLKAILRSRGTRLMIGVAFLYSVTSSLGKQATILSSATAFPGIYFGVLWVALVAIYLAMGHRPSAFLRAVRERPALLISVGAMDGLTFLAHSIGVLLAPVAYFVAVKRLSAVFSVFVGGLASHDPHLALRVAGATCMVAGVALLTLGS